MRFRAWTIGRFYVATFEHTGSYPRNERAWTVVGSVLFGTGRALCFRPWLHRTAQHRRHRALVLGVRA